MEKPSREDVEQGLKMAQGLVDLVRDLNADDLWINQKGWRVGQVGLQLRLVFTHAHDKQIREQILKIMDLYLSIVPLDNLMWWWYSGNKKRNPLGVITGKAQKSMAEFRLLADIPEEPFYTCLASNDTDMDVENFKLNAQRYLFRIAGGPVDGVCPDEGVSEIVIGFPMEWGKSRPAGRGFSWFCKEAVRMLQPRWATAGWGLILPPKPYLDLVDTPTILYEVLTRFPGVEGVRSMVDDEMVNHLYTVNWLNFVHEDLLGKLGGRELVKQACTVTGELTETEDIDSCLCIQAGPLPLLGSSARDDFIPAYQVVARILKPIRIPFMINTCYMPQGKTHKESLHLANDAYLRRFDVPEEE